MNTSEKGCAATGVVRAYREGSVERGGATVSTWRSVLTHYVVVMPGEDEPEITRAYLEGKGDTLPVFSAR